MDTNLLGTGCVVGTGGEEIPPTPLVKGGNGAGVVAPELMVAADGTVIEVPVHLKPYAVGVSVGFPRRWELRAIGLGYLNASKIALRIRQGAGLRPDEVSVSELFAPDGAWLWPYEGAASEMRRMLVELEQLKRQVKEQLAMVGLMVEQEAEGRQASLALELRPDCSVRWREVGES